MDSVDTIPRLFRDRVLVLGAVLALAAAAILVVYLEYRANDLERRQNQVILQQVCDRTATVLAGRFRRLLDAAVLETLESIAHGHPFTSDDAPILAPLWAKGLQRHPYVDEFFIWTSNRESILSADQVLFYSPKWDANGAVTRISGPDGRVLGSLVTHPGLGREILSLARQVPAPHTFLVVERTIGGIPYQLILHVLWKDDRRKELFAVAGYTVDLRRINASLLRGLVDSEFRPFLNPDPHSPHLAVALLDEASQVVYGDAVPGATVSATVPVDMLFFPGEPLRAFLLAGTLNVRQWHLQVSVPRSSGPTPYFGPWVTSAVVLLIIIAVVCAFTVDKQARQLSQMQSDFVANVSHQLKTPLSLLSTAIDTLCMGRVPSDRINQYLGILLAQTSRMTRLVDRILQFARMESGTDIHQMEPVDLVPLVQTTVTGFNIEALQTQVPISFNAHSDVVMARADPVAIEEAVANLLENAVKYGDEHNEVHVSVQQRDGEVLVAVKDRGIGVHTSDLPYIFDKFYRGRRGADHGRRGFGLGLALVRSIARAHGGRVTVNTTYNSGSTFTLVIPALSMETSRGSSDSAD